MKQSNVEKIALFKNIKSNLNRGANLTTISKSVNLPKDELKNIIYSHRDYFTIGDIKPNDIKKCQSTQYLFEKKVEPQKEQNTVNVEVDEIFYITIPQINHGLQTKSGYWGDEGKLNRLMYCIQEGYSVSKIYNYFTTQGFNKDRGKFYKSITNLFYRQGRQDLTDRIRYLNKLDRLDKKIELLSSKRNANINKNIDVDIITDDDIKEKQNNDNIETTVKSSQDLNIKNDNSKAIVKLVVKHLINLLEDINNL